MDEFDSYTYARMNEVDHNPNSPRRHYDTDSGKANVATTTTPDDTTNINLTEEKAYKPIAGATRSTQQFSSVSWKAIWSFAATFTAMLVALEVIYQFSKKGIGLATSSSSKHYLWTYGPTALLVVVAALWRQLDYRTKQLMPWAELAKGPTLPEKSVLLDYISPILPIAMYRSLKNRHFVVFTTIMVFIAIKIIMIVSTGLLVLENVLVDGMPTQLLVTDEFDAGNFRNRSTGRSRAALAVQGIQKYHLSYPLGTTSEYAFQSFDATATSSASVLATLNGTVDYFTADLDCEVGNVSHTIGFRPLDRNFPHYYNTSLWTKTCQVHNAYMDAPLFDDATNTTAGYFALTQPVNCTDADSGRDDAHRLMISIGYSRASNATETGSDRTLVNVTGILCTPRYNLGRAMVIQSTTSPGQHSVDIFPIRESNRQLTGLSSWDVAKGVLSAMANAPPKVNGSSFYRPPDPVTLRDDPTVSIDAFFELFMSAHPDVPLNAYMDPQNLITASKKTYKSLAAQVAHQNLMPPAQHVIEGSFSDHVDRIMVQELPLRLMQGLLSATIVMTIIVGLLMPRHALLGSVNCIGFYISVFRRSLPALKPFEGSGVCSMDQIRQILRVYRFQTDVVQVGGYPECRILTTTTDRILRTAECSDGNLPRDKWWRPVAFSLPAMSFSLLMPPVFIVVLEILVQYSHRNQGLVDVDPDSRYRYTWLFGPTLLLVLVATLFNILDFEIETIQPFQRLRRPAATARSSILNNPLSKLTPLVLWDAVCFRDIALGVAAVSVILAPFLPIVASGLYTIHNVAHPIGAQVQPVDSFQNLSRGVQDRSLAVLPGLIAQQNLTYPQWSYNELALPKVNLAPPGPNAKLESPNDAVSVATKVPALRGAMNCSVLPQPRIEKSEIGFNEKSNGTELRFTVDLRPSCTTVAEDRFYNSTIPVASSLRNTGGYIGLIFPPCNEGDSVLLLLSLGYIEHNQTKALQFLLCDPYTEQLDVDLTLMLPSYSISPLHPPMAIESSARFFSKTGFMPTNIPSLEGYFPTTLEGFFQILMYGKDGIPGHELLSNTTRLVEAVEHQYRIFVAQAYNMKYRSPFDPQSNRSDASTFDATLVSSSRSRLVQSQVSTRIIQVLLVALFICAITTYTILWRSTNGTRRILPHNPTSIAAMATLLVDSNLLTAETSNIPPGMEFMSNKEMEDSGVFDGWEFSLGWWDRNVGGRQRYGIDVGQAAHDRDRIG